MAFDLRPLWIFSLLAFCVSFSFPYFFRDPERIPPDGDGLVVSPADGRVQEIARTSGGDAKVGIFMSLWNVHVVRSPIPGKVLRVVRRSGAHLPAFSTKAGRKNTYVEVVVDGEMEVRVRMIAGALARRVDCWVQEGEEVERGGRIGMIMLGSKVEVFLPGQVELRVEPGDGVRAGESILGVMREA